jgi:hypothetical protein
MGSERIEEVDLFIEKQIETVPHLEVLLLIWRGRPKAWIPSEMSSALYVPREVASKILSTLSARG